MNEATKTDPWAEMVEATWRKKFDHKGPILPSTNEMARMLDNTGW